jgi:hypothetical protein
MLIVYTRRVVVVTISRDIIELLLRSVFSERCKFCEVGFQGVGGIWPFGNGRSVEQSTNAFVAEAIINHAA